MTLFLLCGMACKTEKAGETERERDSRCLRRYSLVFLILLKIHDYKTKKRIANVLLLSWAAVPYHHDISLTFVASSPTNIACIVGCNINTKKSVSFDDKQRPGLASLLRGTGGFGTKRVSGSSFRSLSLLNPRPLPVVCPFFLFPSLDYQLTDCSLRAFLLSGTI